MSQFSICMPSWTKVYLGLPIFDRLVRGLLLLLVLICINWLHILDIKLLLFPWLSVTFFLFSRSSLCFTYGFLVVQKTY